MSLDPDIFEAPAEPDRPLTRPPRPARVPDPAASCNYAEDVRHAERPAPHPGPRCATCWRAELKARKQRAKDRRVEAAYGITPEQYRLLYEAQGGRCYVCRTATGARKRLAVDHDHVLAAQHDHPTIHGCPECIRGLACGWCNRDVLGRLGGNPQTYRALAEHLADPPARRLLREATP